MTGADRIAAERKRQVISEGYLPSHDQGHARELAEAAACYALSHVLWTVGGVPPALWPWHRQYWKPTPNNRIRELEKAGALIAAAIDALMAGSGEA